MLVRDSKARVAPRALLYTDLDRLFAQIVSWFARHWSAEITFREVRRHLGVET
ncbi:hypothetical protein [Methylobacterium sp. V23]|uniref:hypothetical protein n=1 Tax=Methylobacterium sp. V23 TaxID=2044878 RepID=UPI0015E18C79|nr:hypothetical protein [Methylobacterium sp. V23]